jgi:RimJ/RimL family protein N-acetyltransferase
MILEGSRVVLEPITPALAQRIIARDEHSDDRWHPEYPFVDELVPLRSLAASSKPDPDFTLYLIRRTSDQLAVGGFGFFGPPDEQGRVEFGYGLIPNARGGGLATEAVTLGIDHARRSGAKLAAADTDVQNVASQRVLVKAGFTEVARRDAQVFYERSLTTA